MTPFLLRTLGGLSLDGGAGPLRISDPIALGLLCLIRLDPRGAIEEAEAHRYLLPNLPVDEASRRIEAAVGSIARATGIPLITLAGGKLTVDPARLDCDVERSTSPLAAPTTRFLSGFNLPRAAEFRTWAAATRSRVRPRLNVAPPQRRLPDVASIAILGGGLLLLATVYATRSTPPPGFVAGQPVQLMALRISAADTLLDRPLWAAAKAALERSPRATVTADRARFRVTIGIEDAEPGFHLWATLSDTTRSEPVASLERSASTTADAAGAIDHLIDGIRAALGERPTERYARRAPPRATP